jgi:hypothetical protein
MAAFARLLPRGWRDRAVRDFLDDLDDKVAAVPAQQIDRLNLLSDEVRGSRARVPPDGAVPAGSKAFRPPGAHRGSGLPTWPACPHAPRAHERPQRSGEAHRSPAELLAPLNSAEYFLRPMITPSTRHPTQPVRRTQGAPMRSLRPRRRSKVERAGEDHRQQARLGFVQPDRGVLPVP